MISGLSKLTGSKMPPWLMPAVGYAIAILSLVWVFHGIDLETILKDFESLDWGWVVIAVIADVSVYVWQAWRWNMLLSPVVKPPLGRSVRAIYVGLFANEIFPLRTGELLRCFLQARWSSIPFSVAVSSAMIERIFDGIWLMLAFFAATVFVPLPNFLVEAGKIMAGAIVALALILGLIMFWKHHAHAAVAKTRWKAKLQILVDDLHAMGNSRSFYLAGLISVGYLLMQVIPIYGLLQAYGMDLSIGPAMVVLLILRLGTVVPQAPGNVGSFQALTVLSLGLFGVDKTTAAGFSLIMWGVITLPLLIAGFIALAVTGLKFDELREHCKAQLTPPPTIAPAETQSH